ncbi:MAG: 3D-(3,5/4)-trihydroxycyclohexane-1,2-dione acylhydrolase (decyclizing) [Thermaceae bacterium]|nr:3D-(3,5/4)-trihydroxycyclohexane-1,2-dione acylhydrolase (decyclizing) [Thermaceae bacterium]
MTQRLTVAQAIVQFLANQYSERDGKQTRIIPGFWAIFGHGNVAGLGQALEQMGEDLRMPTYRPQNEQAMVHLAAAYAKHTNRMSTYACTASIGPGSTNMLTAAAGATINRLPVLLFPSDYFGNRIPDPVLQQLEHPIEHDSSVNDAFRLVSRFYTRITRPEQVLSALPEAMRVLTDPAETGAVTISLPEDVQTEAYDWPNEFFAKRVWHIRRPVPEPEVLAQVAELIKKAKRPLILAGGGVMYAEANQALAEFAQTFGIPVSESQAGKGAIPWNHPMNMGAIGSAGGLAANMLAKNADLVIAIGTRLGDFVTASKTAFQNPAVRFVGLNVVPMDAAKLSGVSLVADAKRGLEALTKTLGNFKGTSATYQKEAAQLKAEWDKIVSEYRTPQPQKPRLAQTEVIGMVNEFVGNKATVICAAGSMPGDLLKLWRPEDPKAYHVEYGFSCMGYEIPAALGIKLAEPKREVVVFMGDGTYLMMNSEIVTAVAEGLDFTLMLIDNKGYGSIRRLQMETGSPSFNNELRHRNAKSGRTDGPPVQVDFAKHAEAMGAKAWHVKSYEELEAALVRARKTKGVKVIVVPVSLDESARGFESWWDAPMSQVSDRPKVIKARKAYEVKVKRQRKYFSP